MKSLRADPAVELLAADMDPWAAGLYLVPPGARTLIPAGAAPDFTDVLLARCLALGVDVVLPTVDAELRPLARARETFAAAGIDLLLASAAALEVILDKLTLARHCAGVVRVPRTEPFESRLDPAEWSYPVVVKPRTGSGSRGLMTVGSAGELASLPRSPSLIVQEFLPGEEYSVDVLADAGGHVIASVPRLRARVDSGVSVGGRTVHDAEVEWFGRVVAEATGVTYVANVQCKRDRDGVPALLEVNPRMPGTLGLTIASGVDMPRLALAALLGQPVPAAMDFRELAVVRFLDERFIDPAEISGYLAAPRERPVMSRSRRARRGLSRALDVLRRGKHPGRERPGRPGAGAPHAVPRRPRSAGHGLAARLHRRRVALSAAGRGCASWPASRPRSWTPPAGSTSRPAWTASTWC